MECPDHWEEGEEALMGFFLSFLTLGIGNVTALVVSLLALFVLFLLVMSRGGIGRRMRALLVVIFLVALAGMLGSMTAKRGLAYYLGFFGSSPAVTIGGLAFILVLVFFLSWLVMARKKIRPAWLWLLVAATVVILVIAVDYLVLALDIYNFSVSKPPVQG